MDGSQLATTWIEIGSISDIPKLGSRVVRTSRGDIAIFRTSDDSIFALDDRCPHKGGPLSQGIVHGHSVTCPLHAWRIALATGEAEAPDHGCTRTIPLRLEGEQIFLGLTFEEPAEAAQ